MYDLCVFYSNKIKFKDDFASLSLLVMDDADGATNQNSSTHQKSSSENLAGGKPTKSEINEK
jgi:hypothetical protein